MLIAQRRGGRSKKRYTNDIHMKICSTLLVIKQMKIENNEITLHTNNNGQDKKFINFDVLQR